MEVAQIILGGTSCGTSEEAALMEKWLLVRETLECEFDVYRNLKQAGIQNKLGKSMGKAIKETGDGTEQKNDSPFPSVVPGHCG